jgi:hypothetical protein
MNKSIFAKKSIVGTREDMASTNDRPNRGTPPTTFSSNSISAHTPIPQLDEGVLAKLSLTLSQSHIFSSKGAVSTANAQNERINDECARLTTQKEIAFPLPATIYQPKSHNPLIFNSHTTLDQAPFPWKRDPEINFVALDSTYHQINVQSTSHGELHFHRKPHFSHYLFEDLESSTLGPLEKLDLRHHAFSDPSSSTLAPLSKPPTRKYFHLEMPKPDTQ